MKFTLGAVIIELSSSWTRAALFSIYSNEGLHRFESGWAFHIIPSPRYWKLGFNVDRYSGVPYFRVGFPPLFYFVKSYRK